MDVGRQHRLRRRLLKAGHFIGLFLAMSIICLPGLWVVLNSFRPTVEIMAKPPVWIPTELNLDHYRAMFGGIGEGGVPVLTYFWNSLVISLTSTVIALLVGMAGGYAFARYRIPGKGAIFVSLMVTRAVPGVALSLPLFILYGRLGIIDTHFGMILVYVALNVPFTIWLIDGFSGRCRRSLPRRQRSMAAPVGRPSGRWSFPWRGQGSRVRASSPF